MLILLMVYHLSDGIALCSFPEQDSPFDLFICLFVHLFLLDLILGCILETLKGTSLLWI